MGRSSCSSPSTTKELHGFPNCSLIDSEPVSRYLFLAFPDTTALHPAQVQRKDFLHICPCDEAEVRVRPVSNFIKRFCCYSCVKQSDWLKTFERPIRILGTNLHYNILTNLGLHIFTMFCQYLRSWAKTFYNIDPWPMTAWQIPRRVAMKILPACEGTRSTSRRWPSGDSGYLEEMQVAFTQSELREKIQSIQYLKIIMFQFRFA